MDGNALQPTPSMDDEKVVPAHITGAHQAFPPKAKLPRPCPIQVSLGKPLTFESTSNDRSGWNSVAAQLEEEVRKLDF